MADVCMADMRQVIFGFAPLFFVVFNKRRVLFGLVSDSPPPFFQSYISKEGVLFGLSGLFFPSFSRILKKGGEEGRVLRHFLPLFFANPLKGRGRGECPLTFSSPLFRKSLKKGGKSGTKARNSAAGMFCFEGISPQIDCFRADFLR